MADRPDADRERRAPDAAVASPAEVRITYAPERDGDPDPGEVVWCWVPYEDDPSQGKDRPVVVVGLAGERYFLWGRRCSRRLPTWSSSQGMRAAVLTWVPCT